jgi:hypothetical protein
MSSNGCAVDLPFSLVCKTSSLTVMILQATSDCTFAVVAALLHNVVACEVIPVISALDNLPKVVIVIAFI